MKSVLVLEDGTYFPGLGFGAKGEAIGEVVFNTTMTGYQEITTDPSYNGQIVAILSYEARRGILTANATTPYYLGFADLSSGPLVMQMPASGVQGGEAVDEVIVYCACPNEASAAMVARQLMRAGFKRVRPLAGGFEAWVERGFAVQVQS